MPTDLIQGFPEEKKSGKCYSSCSLCPYQKECPIDEKNKLIETMKLALLKKMDGIDKIIEGIETKHNGYFPITELAQAIKDHLTK